MPAYLFLEEIYGPSHCMAKSRDLMTVYPTKPFQILTLQQRNIILVYSDEKRSRGSKHDSSEEPIVKITLHRPM